VGALTSIGLVVVVIVSGLGVVTWRPDLVVAAPRRVLGLLAAATLAALLGVVNLSTLELRLRIDPSTEPLLPKGDPARAAYLAAVRDFGDDELYSVAIECGEVFSSECLGTIERVSSRIARLDGVRSVSSLTDVPSFRWVEAEQWVEISRFIDEIPDDPAALEALRVRALSDPTYRRILVSDDGAAAAVNVRFRKMDDARFIASGLDASVGEILEDSIPSTMRHHVAGRPHVKVHVYRGIVRDLLVLVPLAVVVMAAVLSFFFRSKRGVGLPLSTAALTNVWTFGLIGWLDEPLSLLTGMLAPMLLAIGSVYGVHVVARYEEEAVRAASPAAAALAALTHVRRPGLVAGFTTIIGFAALLITDVPAVLELGAWSIFGVAAAMSISLLGIPAALALMPLSRPPRGRRDERVAMRVLERGLAGLAGFVVARRRAVSISWAVITVAAVIAIPRLVVDTDYLSYFTADDPIRLDFESVNRLLAGVIPIYVVVDGGEPGSLREPPLLGAMEAAQRRIDALPGVGRTISVVDSVRRLNRAFQADDPGAERIPDSREAVSELLFMLPKADISALITVDHARANLVVRTGTVGSAAVLELADAITREAEAIAPVGAEVRVTGNTILLSRSADGIARSQPLSIGAATLAIALFVTAALGSLTLGLIAMIPNVIPVLIFFGALGAGAASLSLPTSLIGCMALGIAIDDTVHFLARYRAEREAGADPRAAIRIALLRVGRPIAITSAMLCLGFLVVTGSRFATLQAFGLLSAFTMAVCLATDLILLPAILLRTRA
jgi:predicted RND superfamily exporter protein